MMDRIVSFSGRRKAVILLLAAASAMPCAHAHKLSPDGTAEERKLSDIRGNWIADLERFAAQTGLSAFGEPVHEELTDRMFGCDGTACTGESILRAPPAVLAGMRWNDDPPFRIGSREGKGTRCKVAQTIRFQTQPYCWYQLFSDADARAGKGVVFDAESDSALLYRTHFGDLQFLHAMASKDGVAPQDTQQMLLGWAEFNWRIMLGEYVLDTRISGVDIPVMKRNFWKSGWQVQELYTLGSPGLRPYIKDVAFGSILHSLQDSFAEGHVEREAPMPSRSCSIGGSSIEAPGLIREFHAYNNQDHDLHAEADSRGALEAHLQDTPDVVDIGRHLVRAYRANRPWEEVAPFFDCIYALSDDVRRSSPGRQFEQ
jgi:hypothetical protein